MGTHLYSELIFGGIQFALTASFGGGVGQRVVA